MNKVFRRVFPFNENAKIILIFFLGAMMIKLINGDCLEEMRNLINDDVKVDLILTDLPYGTTKCRWDNIIPFEPMWDCIHQLVHQKTPVLLFGQEPFSSHLRLSNLKEFRYDWIWNKLKGTNFLNANRTPLPCHEIISVFYQRLPYYNPQKRYVGVKSKGMVMGGLTHKTYGKVKVHTEWKDDGYRFPLSVIECDKSQTEARNGSNVHPTQKPVRLLEYLIKTYTKKGNLVLDFTMGGEVQELLVETWVEIS